MDRTTRVVEVAEDGRLEEVLVDDGRNDHLVACAPHGGHVEPGTDAQAERLADLLGRDGSCWTCRGTVADGGAFDRWHRPSTRIRTDRFRLLGCVVGRGFRHAVSFHGYGGEGVLVGGGADADRKATLRDAIDGAVRVPVEVVDAGEYAGVHPRNVVNRLPERGGVQLEQSLAVRERNWRTVADAVASVLASD